MLFRNAEGTANRGGVVWHDDGTVKDDAAKEHTMYQRETDNSALSYQESAAAAGAASSADGAQPHIPVPATSTIDETNQDSLAAAQEAGTTASPPVSKSEEDAADVPAHSDSKAAHEPLSTTAGPSRSTHTAQAKSGDSNLAALDNGVTTQIKAAASPAKAEVQPTEQEAADIHQSETPQVSQHDQVSKSAAAVSAADGVAGVPELELLPPSTEAGSVGSAAAAAAGPGPTESDMTEAAQQAATAATADTDSAAAASTSNTATADTDAGALPADPTAPVTTEAPDAETAAAVPADDGAGGNSWKGTGKGPGLGQSQEFSGGPVNFARPKYRHAPYNLPPARGGARFGAGNMWSPRGRASPRGVSSPAGRGYSDPFRLVVLHAVAILSPQTYASAGRNVTSDHWRAPCVGLGAQMSHSQALSVMHTILWLSACTS